MRFHLKLKSNRAIIPFNHQHMLTGVFHKWIGKNEFHGKISLYSFSQLYGAKTKDGGLQFAFGADWYVSIWDGKVAKQFIDGLQNDPEMFLGLSVHEVILMETPNFEIKNHFAVSSPVHIKRFIGDNIEFILFSDNRASEFLTETLKRKMEQAGLPEDPQLKVSFDTSYHGAKTKLITYKDAKRKRAIENKCSVCPIIIEGSTESKAFAWHVGVGNSTGIGFGALK